MFSSGTAFISQKNWGLVHDKVEIWPVQWNCEGTWGLLASKPIFIGGIGQQLQAWNFL